VEISDQDAIERHLRRRVYLHLIGDLDDSFVDPRPALGCCRQRVKEQAASSGECALEK
jgi:hypothetical protein